MAMSDLFHETVPDEFIAKVFGVMAAAAQHTFQVLTKRHGRMRSLLSREDFRELVFLSNNLDQGDVLDDGWPLPNVWLGVSVENQQWADIRIPALLDTPAAVRWLSCEPLLGPVDLRVHLAGHCAEHDFPGGFCVQRHHPGVQHIDWVVVGGESGRNARPMHPDWARSLRDQCTAAGVPFFFKQWGEWAPDNDLQLVGAHTIVPEHGEDRPFTAGAGVTRLGKRKAGRVLDGRTWDEYP